MADYEEFLGELMVLCKKHNASLVPRGEYIGIRWKVKGGRFLQEYREVTGEAAIPRFGPKSTAHALGGQREACPFD